MCLKVQEDGDFSLSEILYLTLLVYFITLKTQILGMSDSENLKGLYKLDKSFFINQFLKSDFFSVFSIVYLKAELIIPNFFRIKTSF